MTPAIGCVLLNYRFPEDTLACLRSLQGPGAEALKIYLVNNHAADGSGPVLKAWLESSGLAFAYLEPGGNLGYTGGMNLGIAAVLADGLPHVLALNNDTVAEPGFAAEALAAAREHPDAVVAGCVLDAATGLPSYNIGRISPRTLLVTDILARDFRGEVDFVSGCLMLVPSAVFRAVGAFDDRYFMYREDFDFCLRLRAAGVGIAYRPSLVVRHKVSSATDRTGTPKEYYRIRNQTHIVLHRGTPAQKAGYLAVLACLMAYKLRHPRVFAQFLRGVLDAFAGRLGRAA